MVASAVAVTEGGCLWEDGVESAVSVVAVMGKAAGCVNAWESASAGSVAASWQIVVRPTSLSSLQRSAAPAVMLPSAESARDVSTLKPYWTIAAAAAEPAAVEATVPCSAPR
jgi:hypothetical protein